MDCESARCGAELAHRFHHETAERIPRRDEQKEGAVEWKRRPEENAGGQQRGRPSRLEKLRGKSLLPFASHIRKVHCDPRMRVLSCATAVEKASYTSEHHAYH